MEKNSPPPNNGSSTVEISRARAAERCAVTIVIDSNNIRPLYEQSCDTVFLLQRELEVWATALNHPTLTEFTLHNPTRFLQAHELTALIRTLAKLYNIQPIEKRLHTVNCDLTDLNRNWLGLFKGLGFNRCLVEIALSDLENTPIVMQKLAKIKEFGFAQLGLVVFPAPALPDLKTAIAPLVKIFNQLHIFLGHTSHNALDTNFELEPDEDSHISINVGPGVDAFVYSEHRYKLHNISLYTQALLNHKLPISTPITLPSRPFN